MSKMILCLIIFVSIFTLIVYRQYIKNKRKEECFLEIGINHKLLFSTNIKPNICKVILKPDKFIKGMSTLAGVGYKVPDISYWYWVNEAGEKIGTTFLIREDKAYQFEMNYSEFFKIENEILEEQSFEEALQKYFEKAIKNVKLVSFQFEDLLVKKNVQYEKIIGI